MFPVTNLYDYVFSENGLVAYKNGELIHKQVTHLMFGKAKTVVAFHNNALYLRAESVFSAQGHLLGAQKSNQINSHQNLWWFLRRGEKPEYPGEKPLWEQSREPKNSNHMSRQV